ncbi:type IV secretory system conjugative DNA transfer family protein [Azohydromonas aeria]|uniref:type IV secretory system conjugative DNA transfer family protein n=1 Tax=Azohydromonas aeria TaxID=2590212 RepID=UPI0012FB70F9|nr:type IV secretory system conjugative DNA transfer family protein [Azohydromonas aeria]
MSTKATITIDTKAVALAGFCTFMVILLTGAALWLSAATFLVINKTNPTRADWDSLPRYWERYGEDPKHKKQLLASMLLAFGLCYVGAPLALWKGAQRRRELYGSARFANEAEIRRAKLLKGKGIIVGRRGKRLLTYDGQQYVLVAAPPRSGKGVSIAVPNGLNFADSMVFLDVKGELRDATSGFRAAHGQEVYVFAPFDKGGCSHRYNPLGYVSTDGRLRVSELQKLANIIFPNGDDSKGSDTANFFADQAQNLFLAMGLYLLETPALPRTIGQMLRMTAGDGKPFRDYLTGLINEREKSGTPLSFDCVAAFGRFLANTADNTLSGIVSTFTGPLKAFADPVTDAATSANDFDLADLRKKRMTVYLVMPFDELAAAKLLLNLFLTQMVHANVQELPSQNPALKYQCLVVLDEFTAAGRIDVIARGIGFMPGYNMRLLIIIQSLAQLSATYGKDTARAIRTACACHVCFAPNEQEDAEEISRRLGTTTVRKASRGRSHSSGRGGGSSSTSTNESEHNRPLLLPQEVKELGAEAELIFIENVPPIQATKARWHEDPLMVERKRARVEVEPINIDLHIARTDFRHRPVEDKDGPVREMPMERLAIDTTGLEVPMEPDTPPDKAEAFLGDFFSRLMPPAEPTPAPVPPKPERARAEPNAIGLDINVAKDGTVKLVAQSVKPRKPRRTENADAAQPAKGGGEAPPAPIKTTLGQSINVDGDGVITVVKPARRATPPADEPAGMWPEIDVQKLNGSAPERPEDGRQL